MIALAILATFLLACIIGFAWGYLLVRELPPPRLDDKQLDITPALKKGRRR